PIIYSGAPSTTPIRTVFVVSTRQAVVSAISRPAFVTMITPSWFSIVTGAGGVESGGVQARRNTAGTWYHIPLMPRNAMGFPQAPKPGSGLCNVNDPAHAGSDDRRQEGITARLFLR